MYSIYLLTQSYLHQHKMHAKENASQVGLRRKHS